jgi:hypothetical protein
MNGERLENIPASLLKAQKYKLQATVLRPVITTIVLASFL